MTGSTKIVKALRYLLRVPVVSLSLAGSAHAAAVLCSGTVNSIAVAAGGSLLVSYGNVGGVHTVCSVSATYFEVDKDTCKAWFAVIQAAKAQQRTIRFYYDSAVSGNPSSCTSITYGQGTRPYFLETLD
jgi:hypothetical protein